MSGRENIYINATIFGLKRGEIDRRLPEIIRFSELEEFIDNPVRTYKCFQRLREIKEQGTTIVIVSHAVEQMYGICDRLIWIEGGTVREDGLPKPVAMHYLDFIEDERLKKLNDKSRNLFQDTGRHSILELTANVHPNADRDGSQEVYFTAISLLDNKNKSCQSFDTGEIISEFT